MLVVFKSPLKDAGIKYLWPKEFVSSFLCGNLVKTRAQMIGSEQKLFLISKLKIIIDYRFHKDI